MNEFEREIRFRFIIKNLENKFTNKSKTDDNTQTRYITFGNIFNNKIICH